MNLTIDDFKNLLLDLYMAQREISALRSGSAEAHEHTHHAPEGREDEEG
jgi:hypothetical protein